MLIKEYRIPMPMSVEEYRIAQLYMIQKKSREESCGEGSGVEILENRPYEDGPGGSGQYTRKVYHIGKHIPSWFCSILPQAALRVEEESWNAYPYTRTRYTCPFVEKFSIDIETYYKPDTGNQADVFNMSSAEKRQRTVDPIDIVKDCIPPHEYLVEEDPKLYRSVKTRRGPLSDDWIEEVSRNPGQSPVMCAYKLCKVEFRYWGMQSKIERFIHDVGLRKVMVRAHRQAWCWQDEWYGLTIEDIRLLELETQLALAKKMAQYSLNEEGGAETNGSSAASQEQEQGAEMVGSAVEAEGGGGKLRDSLETRGELTKQWSASSRSSNRSSKRGGSPSHQNISEWRMESIARDSEDSTDEEFFDAHEDLSDNEETFTKDMTKWNSNDLMDKIDTMEMEEAQAAYQESGGEYAVMRNEERQMEGCSSQRCLQPSKIHVLILVLHGGNILDTGSGEQNSKQGDGNTLSGAFETVMRVHYPTALGRIAIRMVPCPAVCVDAFSLVSHLSPYSYDESCLSSSQDHIPLAALPLLATSAPQYQDAVASVILRANQAYGDFIKSLEGESFNGQVCVIGDCVGGILGFDALCSSAVTVSESQNSSRRGSGISMQDTDLLSPGIVINSVSPSSLSLEGSRHLSRSNIDIPRCPGPDDPKRQLPRKRSDSSTYELDTIKHHQAFLSSLHSSVLHGEPGSRRSSNSTMLEGGSLGKFDFEVTDFFLFGSPLGLVLALRKTVVPSLDVSALRPACQQVYNLFHPADPSASRLEPLLHKRFYLMPPFSVPRYQRFPLGDGHSALLVETVQSNPHLLMDSGGAASHRCQETAVSETSIPVPVLNCQTLQLHTETDSLHSPVSVDGLSPSPSSPGVPHLRFNRRASEASLTSQVSGIADSYAVSNVATTHKASHAKRATPRLTVPRSRFISRTPSLRSRHKKRQVCPEPNGVESEPRSDISSDVTSDLSDVTSDIGSVPPSPRVLKNIEQVASRWWGSKRMDYALYCPDALTAFPTVALPHLFHASYWESTDVVSFLLRQVMRHENSSILEVDGKEVSEFTPSKPREKWLRKRTHVKIRNVTANHRVNDVVFTEDGSQVVTGRFMYGPLDMVTLTGEKTLQV
ncbi:membrane-associated phosphatidylinositol transfer protein 2-like [Brachionichthys hirsutus]|uniref:membrane-associated phosphatidylinositol transfer protein 2-like n=1 Tax=Brachionichthys hirsutus TaxID=412623 RepID=UPI00360531F8